VDVVSGVVEEDDIDERHERAAWAALAGATAEDKTRHGARSPSSLFPSRPGVWLSGSAPINVYTSKNFFYNYLLPNALVYPSVLDG
jgi:hypothetical protein